MVIFAAVGGSNLTAAVSPTTFSFAGVNGGAGIDKNFQRRSHGLTLLCGNMFQHLQGTEDPSFAALVHHLFASGSELQAANAAVALFGHALDQPRTFQAVGNLGQSAERYAQGTAQGRHRPRTFAKDPAQPQLRQGQIIGGILLRRR